MDLKISKAQERINSMWILMWMQLLSGIQVEHYQLGSFTKEIECKKAESRAQVMKQNNGTAIFCVKVDIERFLNDNSDLY